MVIRNPTAFALQDGQLSSLGGTCSITKHWLRQRSPSRFDLVSLIGSPLDKAVTQGSKGPWPITLEKSLDGYGQTLNRHP
jgi:hypothetical protein